jgi:thioredoxin reductase/bacterioferritin-associated ferredoxin
MRDLTSHQRHGQELIRQVVEAGVNVLSDTLVWQASPNKTLACIHQDSSFQLHAQALILATGTYERPVPFPGWTLPGVILAGGAQAMLYQRVLPGKRVLLAGTGPLQLVVAAKLVRAGAEVAGVLEGASLIQKGMRYAGTMWGQWERLREGLSSYLTLAGRGVPYRLGWGILEALGAEQVEAVRIARLDQDWRPIAGTEQEVACDTLCVGYGFVPFSNLTQMMGAKHAYRPDLGGVTPVRGESMETSLPGVYAVGDGAGIGGIYSSQIEGQIAGIAAAAELGCQASTAREAIECLRPALGRERAFQKLYSDLFTPGPGVYELASDDTLVCRCEGVTLGKLRQTLARGASSVMEVKNASRSGMGECQGRMCGSFLTHYLASQLGKPSEELGAYPVRPPVFPVPIQALAGLEMTDEPVPPA